MQGTASSKLIPTTSLVIRRPLFGCQYCGTTLAVAFYKTPDVSEVSLYNIFENKHVAKTIIS